MTGMDQQELSAIARKHGIRLLLQFGSSVTGRMHHASDIDLAVLLERLPESLFAEGGLVADLQALGGGRDVDLAFINRADPLLLKQIAAHARLVFGSTREFEAFKLYAFKRYQDHRPYLQMERDYVNRAVDRRMR
jgi:predicted nucleotidyltransferase